ncbi:MAG: T9SS type A sorting domain-containing protein [Rubricoccaceae bacterium]|nr:T9SS type A sorting domain-containing protein [Rubricoccaceae bacterium]
MAASGSASVTVYDVLERQVAVVHEGPLRAGRHAFRLDGRALSPGVYIVRAEATGGVTTRRMVRLR